MKKTIIIIIAIMLLMPQQALCLRPAAYKLLQKENVEKTGFELDPNRNREEIVSKNKQYLVTKGWSEVLELIEKLPYEPLYILEDENFPKFMDSLFHYVRRRINFRNTFTATEEEITKLGAIPQATEEETYQIVRDNIVYLAHLLQCAYFYSQGLLVEAECTSGQVEKSRKTPRMELGEFYLFSQTVSDDFLDLADEFYMSYLRDYDKAYFLLHLGLKLFDHDKNRHLVDAFAGKIMAIDCWIKHKDSALAHRLYVEGWYFAEKSRALAASDTEFGRRLNEHFKQTKASTIAASHCVTRPGIALVLGAGAFVVLPLAEMLKERLPDETIKYEKIILVELAEGLSERALERLIQSGEITPEEAQRVIISNSDATLVLYSVFAKINKIMLSGLKSTKGRKALAGKLIRFYKELADAERLADYALPLERRFKDNCFNFVVFAMTLSDFSVTINYWIDLWMERFRYERGDEKIYTEWQNRQSSIERSMAKVILNELARILAPGGIVFFEDVTAAVDKNVRLNLSGPRGIEDLMPEGSIFELISRDLWKRPPNLPPSEVNEDSYFVIESAILKKPSVTAGTKCNLGASSDVVAEIESSA